MKKLLAKWLGLYTREDVEDEKEITELNKRRYYENVLKQLHHNGTIPPNCDIRMPKLNVKLYRIDEPNEGEIIAENGKWKRLPMDGEVLKVGYKQNN